jgi:dienelactone hydrolase
MTSPSPRVLDFESGGLRCAATLYLPTRVGERPPCVVMAHGFTGTRDLLAPYAEAFAAAGLAVLTFDYRHFGDSEGEPRQVVDVSEQMDDWRAAIRFARTLEGVDARRIALWGSSLSGGHVINLAAEDPTLAAVVAQVPSVDKSLRTISAETRARLAREGTSVRRVMTSSVASLAAAVYDELRGLLHLSPYYMRVFGPPGSVAVFTDPDSPRFLESFSRAGGTWRNRFAPRFLFGTPRYIPGTAERVTMPLLVCVAEQDTEANPVLAVEIARGAPRGELRTYPVPHFAVYEGTVLAQIIADQTEFLVRTLDGPDAVPGVADAPDDPSALLG